MQPQPARTRFFERAYREALSAPALAFEGARRLGIPIHLAALGVGALVQYLTGEPPKFHREEDDEIE